MLEIARADVTGLPRYEERIFSPEQLQRGYGTLQSLRRYRANVGKWIAKKRLALALHYQIYNLFLKENPGEGWRGNWERCCGLRANALNSYLNALLPKWTYQYYYHEVVTTRFLFLQHSYVGVYETATGIRAEVLDPWIFRKFSFLYGFIFYRR